MSRTTKGVAVVAAAALCGSVVTIVLRGTPAPAAPSPPPVGTARVVVTDLSSSVLTEGTLGYAASPSVVNRRAGTYTSLLSPGSVVEAGQALYRVDNEPVVLMSGSVPAWRPFAPGMTDGPDVQELETNLIALGDARGLLSVASSHYDAAASAAVSRWQTAEGLAATGSIDLGDVVFAGVAVRIASVSVSPGRVASPGDLPYVLTTTSRTVSVPLTPDDPAVSPGQAVSVILPSGSSVPGHVTAVGPPPPASSGGSSTSGSGSSSSGGSGSSATTVLTVVPDDPAATGTDDDVSVQVSLVIQSVHHVMAVPVAALLALAGGGYGVEVVEPSRRHTLVGVNTGVFAGGDVQVSGNGLHAGDRVVVAQ